MRKTVALVSAVTLSLALGACSAVEQSSAQTETMPLPKSYPAQLTITLWHSEAKPADTSVIPDGAEKVKTSTVAIKSGADLKYATSQFTNQAWEQKPNGGVGYYWFVLSWGK